MIFREDFILVKDEEVASKEDGKGQLLECSDLLVVVPHHEDEDEHLEHNYNVVPVDTEWHLLVDAVETSVCEHYNLKP